MMVLQLERDDRNSIAHPSIAGKQLLNLDEMFIESEM